MHIIMLIKLFCLLIVPFPFFPGCYGAQLCPFRLPGSAKSLSRRPKRCGRPPRVAGMIFYYFHSLGGDSTRRNSLVKKNFVFFSTINNIEVLGCFFFTFCHGSSNRRNRRRAGTALLKRRKT